jgi:two-component system nitrogen regulation response regulator NtrX
MRLGHILVVDDEPDIRQLVQEILEDEGYDVSVAEDAARARHARRVRRPDLTLLDIWMPDTDGISLLKEWADSTGVDTPVIIMSGHGSVESAVEATRLGAYDFIEKPLSMAKLLLTVRHALEASRLRHENIGLRRHALQVAEPIGKSPTMQALRDQTRRIAAHDTAVLIHGEPGCGKQVFARYLHAHSARRSGAFVDVAVGGLVSDGAVVELFGSEEREKVHYGWLEQANGGDLFLSDVADMDLALQARLFSALQQQSFLRLGGHEPVRIDVRIVAATSQDLAGEVARGRFRDELYYHLNVVPIQIPPLREHREDVPELLDFYVNLLVNQDNVPYRRFNMAAKNFLRNYGWPGNVRELQNLVQRLLILGSTEEVSLEEVEAAVSAEPAQGAPGEFPGLDLPLREARELFEKAYLEHQLQVTGGNVSQTAERVGLERTHLYRKLRSLGIDPKRLKG